MEEQSLFERTGDEHHGWHWAQTPPRRACQVRVRLRVLDHPVVIAGDLQLARVESLAGGVRVVNFLRYGTEIDRKSCVVAGRPLPLVGHQTLLVVMKHPNGTADTVLDDTAVRVCLDAPACYGRIVLVNVVPVVCGNARYLRPKALLEDAATYGANHWQQVSLTGERRPLTAAKLRACDAHNPKMVAQTTGDCAVPGLRNAAVIRQILLLRPDADVLLATGALRCAIETGGQALGLAYRHLLATLAPLADLKRLYVLGVCADRQYGKSPCPQNPRDAVPLVDGAWVMHPVALGRCGRRQVLVPKD